MRFRPTQKRIMAPGVGRIMDAVAPYSKLMTVVDEAIVKLADSQKLSFSCKKGCSACCKQLVMVSIPEALFIMAYLTRDGMRWGIYQKSKNTIAGHVAMISKEPDLYGEDGPDAWFAKQVNCGLLNVDGHCTVYQCRPIACRVRLALDDAKLCENNAESGRFINPEHYFEALTRVNKLVGKDLRIPAVLLPLPVAITFANVGFEFGLATLREKTRDIVTVKERAPSGDSLTKTLDDLQSSIAE